MSSPKKNVAYEFDIALIDSADTGSFKVNPTIAAGDFKVSTDNGAFANLATLPVVSPAGSTLVKINLSAAEMNGDKINVQCIDAAGAEWDDVLIFIDATVVNVDDVVRSTTPANTLAVDANNRIDVGKLLGETAGITNFNTLYDGVEGFAGAYAGPRGPGVYLNDVAGNTNTVNGVDGTWANPVSTIGAAKTIADSLSVDRIYLINNSSVTLTAAMEDYEFVGIGEMTVNIVNFGTQDVDRSVFYNLLLTGTQGGTGRCQVVGCCLSVISGMEVTALGCLIADAGSLTLRNDCAFDSCFSAVAGSGTPTLNINSVASVNVYFRHYSGGMQIDNAVATTIISYEADGQLVVDASCTSLTVVVRGNCSITDNGTTTSLTQDAAVTRSGIVDEWETQSQADPTGFHVNVQEWLGTAVATPTVAGVPEVDITFLGGAAQSLLDLKDFADVCYDPTLSQVSIKPNQDFSGLYSGQTLGNYIQNINTNVVSVLIDTNELQTDDVPGLIGALNNVSTEDVADAVWDEAYAGHIVAGSFGILIGSAFEEV